MQRASSSLLVAALASALVVSCGGSNASTNKPPAPLPPPIDTTPEATGALDWLFADNEELAVHLDVAQLRTHPMFAQLLGLPAAKEQLAKLCDIDFEAALKEVVFVSGRKSEVGGGATLGIDDEAAMGCLAKVAPDWARGTYRDLPSLVNGSAMFVVANGVLVAGDRPFVDRALDRRAAGKAGKLAARMKLVSPVAGRAWYAPMKLEGTLTASADQFAIEVKATPGEKAAREIGEELKHSLPEAIDELANGDAKRKDALRKIADELVLEASGPNVTARFVHGGGVEGQRALAKLVADVTGSAIHRYLLRAKTAEARSNLVSIDYGLRSSFETSHKLPPSAPPVPSTIPKGTTYASKASDWSAPGWQAVHFSLEHEPQRFQYEIVTAPDGKSAIIRARGDLDGNGVTSLYELRVRVDAQTNMLVDDGPMHIEHAEE